MDESSCLQVQVAVKITAVQVETKATAIAIAIVIQHQPAIIHSQIPMQALHLKTPIQQKVMEMQVVETITPRPRSKKLMMA